MSYMASRDVSLQVHAWEPNLQHRSALRALAGRSRLGSRFTLHPQAAWTVDGTVCQHDQLTTSVMLSRLPAACGIHVHGHGGGCMTPSAHLTPHTLHPEP